MSIEPAEVGRRIKAARERRGWTQLDFAREANVSPSTVQRWEAGKLPTVRELIRVAGVLGVPPEDLVEFAQEPEPLTKDDFAQAFEQWRVSLIGSTGEEEWRDEVRERLDSQAEMLRELTLGVRELQQRRG